MSLKNICVFCGSADGNTPIFAQVAQETGETLAQEGLNLVYGGAMVGLMGRVADHCLAAGGKVSGVIPEYLFNKEIAHKGLTELFVVNNMHERKAKMHELSDGFVVLPGGLGTMEELFEVMTWVQLGIQNAPCVLININGFFDPLLAFLDNSISSGFMKRSHLDNFRVVQKVKEMVPALRKPIRSIDKWAESKIS